MPTLVTVRASYRTAANAPASGRVQFTLSATAQHAAENLVFEPVPVVVALDEDGEISVDLLATDDPALLPEGLTYTVVEFVTNALPRTWSLVVPTAAAGPGLDLADVAPALPDTPAYPYVLESVFNAHLADPTGAHAASAVSFTPTGSVAATDVQAAIAEAASDAAQRSANLSDLASATAARTNLGLGNVDDTSDEDKPVSTAAQAALDGKVAKGGDTMTGPLAVNADDAGAYAVSALNADPVGHGFQMQLASSSANAFAATVFGDNHHRLLVTADGDIEIGDGANPRDTTVRRSGPGEVTTDGDFVVAGSTTTGDLAVSGAVTGIDKADVGLSNVDNTSDSNKPVSTAQQAAIDAVSAAVTAHVGDTADAHDASAVSFAPTGSVSATDVQAAIAEVADEAAQKSANLSDLASTATARTNLGALPPDVQTFTSSGTWTKPAGAVLVTVCGLAPGGGGGSGRRGAAGTVRCGGGGGGGGAFVEYTFRASDLPGTVAVTVGSGGTGGAAVTADDTNGAAGSSGSAHTFGSLLQAGPGNGGGGGTTSTGSGGAGRTGIVNGTNGAAASVTGGAGVGPTNSIVPTGAGAGGNSGGGITAANAPGNGGVTATGNFYLAPLTPATGGVVGGASPGNGASVADGIVMSGMAGGGGAASITGPAQAGGNAGNYGAGGSGGGASLNGNASGAGSNGGPGIWQVITHF